MTAQAKSITKHLDDFIKAHPTFDKVDLILEYVKDLTDVINNSQLLQAELVYMFFAGPECPINYNAAQDYWHAWDGRWHTSGHTMSKVKLYLQTDFLTVMRLVVAKAKK